MAAWGLTADEHSGPPETNVYYYPDNRYSRPDRSRVAIESVRVAGWKWGGGEAGDDRQYSLYAPCLGSRTGFLVLEGIWVWEL